MIRVAVEDSNYPMFTLTDFFFNVFKVVTKIVTKNMAKWFIPTSPVCNGVERDGAKMELICLNDLYPGGNLRRGHYTGEP